MIGGEAGVSAASSTSDNGGGGARSRRVDQGRRRGVLVEESRGGPTDCAPLVPRRAGPG